MLFSFKKSTSASPLFNEERFAQLRKTEYSTLDSTQQVYLDFTGGNLPPQSVLNKHHALISQHVLGNPHSTNPTSQKATELVENTRKYILDYFNASNYVCVFTSNASAALKIVGESYPFTQKSKFILTSDNHNSVNGIREFCKAKNGTVNYVPLHYDNLQLDEAALNNLLDSASADTHNLFAFPAQSNVSGVKHDLKWIAAAQQKGFDVLLDAAAFVPTSKLDLSVYQPEFVSISFYKIFGYPTGIGCLLIKKSVYDKLQKPWFAGGTVTLVSVVSQDKFLATGHERFEDGTLNYNNIPCIQFGLQYIQSIGIENISKRIQSLILYLYNALLEIKHHNGSPVVKIFGPSNFENRGGNIIMNFFDANGNVIPFQEIESMTNAKNISIRSGCFCNPGIDEINNCISNEEMSKYFSSRNKGDYYEMVAVLGKMRGAIRASVGIATNQKDLDTFIQFVQSLKNKSF